MNAPSFQEVERARETFLNLQRRYWLENNLFSFDWWLLLLLLIIPWLIWWKLANKKIILQVSKISQTNYGLCFKEARKAE
jgi:hypothetical protein